VDPPYEGHANLTWRGSNSGRKRAQKTLAKSCKSWRVRGGSGSR
jgi:hypothetical protein